MDLTALTQAYAAAADAAAIEIAAGGSQPSTLASRLGLEHEPGTIARDTVTGDYVVIQHASQHEIFAAPRQP